ncbi:amylo-alpha-1,6-glucosidase [Luedemannella helvata]|uniref:Glycogen debranching N-terminal domain-containing protein n=1 Tax=Luedemannella helvata TaxID=349315 RepID=A0ABN2KIW4_9ACTN
MRADLVNILVGSTFVVSDTRGDIRPGTDEATGLFYRDMRHLSRWEIRLNGRELDSLSATTIEYDEAVFYLIEPTGTVYRNPTVSLLRRRFVGDGMHEQLEVTNHGIEPIHLELSILFAADFADIFEVKDQLAKVGEFHQVVGDTRTTLTYRRDDFSRETSVLAPGAFLTEESLTYRVELGPAQTWRTELQVAVGTQLTGPTPRRALHQPDMAAGLDDWLAAAPVLECGWEDLTRTYRRSLVDLAALRFYPESFPDSSLPAAGLPWFMALFGRDSLITSYQALPFMPELARTTLRALAAQQATEADPFRDADPGKILHELRHGELTYFGQRPQSPYYGSCDATPLFLVVLDEYERWTGDVATVRALEPAARAALAWMDEHADLTGSGYLDYQTRNPESGLVNQCWKDSWNSIVHPDGRLASHPHATCEIQGYAFDARMRAARLAEQIWGDAELAATLRASAAKLQERFVNDFYLPDEGWYALALDGERTPVPTLTSNIGHLLWSGIVPEEHVDDLAGHLMGERLFSGWGVRTMASGQPAYNPLEYHNGTVWPHDNALIAAGLARYGRTEAAARIAVALFEAASQVNYRLPEALVGYARRPGHPPVAYPSACSPQAWAAGTPLLLLRALLGLEPEGDRLLSRPVQVDAIGWLALRGIPGRWGRSDTTR